MAIELLIILTINNISLIGRQKTIQPPSIRFPGPGVEQIHFNDFVFELIHFRLFRMEIFMKNFSFFFLVLHSSDKQVSNDSFLILACHLARSNERNLKHANTHMI